MSRVWIAVAVALAVGLGGWFVLRPTTDGPGDQVPVAAERDSEARKRPALPSTGVTRTPYWEKTAKATTGAEGAPALTPAAASDDAVPRAERAFRRPTAPGADPSVVTQTEVDRAIARAEALDGKPLTKEKRLELEKRLASRKPKQVERVPGTAQMREQASCTGSDAQQRYKGMTATEQAQMRERCKAHGFVPPQ